MNAPKLLEPIWDTDSREPGTHPCGRCARTGRYITYTENGAPKGPGGECFRCGGKGEHTRADRRRNLAHDRHAMARAMRADR